MNASYKKSEMGEMPEEWGVSKISSLGKVVTGKTPSTKNRSFWNGNIPFVTPTDIIENRVQERTARKVTQLGLEESSEIPPNSLMVTCIASIGKNAISKERCCTNQQINTVIPKPNVSIEYLYYYMEYIKPKLELLAGKTAVPILNKTEFESLRVPLPPLPEQKKIASVLSTVDAAIEKTSEIIEQAKQLKKGLMQELLTQGIGHQKFKQTEIGEMPEEWEIIRLGELAEIVSGSTPSTNQLEYWGGSFAFVTPTDVTALNGKIYLEKTEKKLTEKGRAILSAKTIPAGSVLFTSRASVGFCAINTMPVVTNQGFANFICKDRVYNLFLYYLLSALKTRFEQLGNGSTFLEVSRKALKRTSIALPPLPEQKKIAEILGAADAKIEAEVQKREQLQTLKKGLMQDLLTGRVRFPEFVKGANS